MDTGGWRPVGNGEDDEQLMLALGLQSKREITRLRVRTALAAQTWGTRPVPGRPPAVRVIRAIALPVSGLAKVTAPAHPAPMHHAEPLGRPTCRPSCPVPLLALWNPSASQHHAHPVAGHFKPTRPVTVFGRFPQVSD